METALTRFPSELATAATQPGAALFFTKPLATNFKDPPESMLLVGGADYPSWNQAIHSHLRQFGGSALVVWEGAPRPAVWDKCDTLMLKFLKVLLSGKIMSLARALITAGALRVTLQLSAKSKSRQRSLWSGQTVSGVPVKLHFYGDFEVYMPVGTEISRQGSLGGVGTAAGEGNTFDRQGLGPEVGNLLFSRKREL